MPGVLDGLLLHSFYPWCHSVLFTWIQNLKKNTAPDNSLNMQVETNKLLAALLAVYPEELHLAVEKLRELIKQTLPGIIEQVDLTAKMIAFSFGQKYAEMICTIFISKKGLKLSFYRGVDLSDPKNLLEGSAKTTRYLSFNYPLDDLPSKEIVSFLGNAHQLCLQRMQVQ